jgi:hypothetical protein
MPSPFEPFKIVTTTNRSTPIVKSLRLLELRGPYFESPSSAPPWLRWFVEVVGRVEIHNQPLIDEFLLRDDMLTATCPDRPNFSLAIVGHAWPSHIDAISPKLEQYGIMHQYRYEEIVEAHAASQTDPVLRPAVYLVKKYLQVMNDLQLVVRD